MPVSLDLHYVDELIKIRGRALGEGPGAPKLIEGVRAGQSITRSCVVMLSALLQAYVEEVLVSCAVELLPRLADQNNLEKFRKSRYLVGNPNQENINRAFLRLGCRNVLADISWQKSNNDTVLLRLKELNQLRNDIAHGRSTLRIDGNPVSLRLAKVASLRNFVKNFGKRFEDHAKSKVL